MNVFKIRVPEYKFKKKIPRTIIFSNSCYSTESKKDKEPRNQVPRKVSISEEGLKGFLHKYCFSCGFRKLNIQSEDQISGIEENP